MRLTEEMVKMREDGTSYAKIAKKFGVAKSTIQEAFGARTRGDRPIPVKEPIKPRAGRSLSDFRNQYDKDVIVPSKIRTALKELRSSWVYEKEFVHMTGVSFNDMGNYREMFADHIVNLRQENKRVWAGTPKLAIQLREMI
jgi:hypothetical protein